MEAEFFSNVMDAQTCKEKHESNGLFAYVVPHTRCGVTVYYVKSMERTPGTVLEGEKQ
jgi:hypothetical protein